MNERMDVARRVPCMHLSSAKPSLTYNNLAGGARQQRRSGTTRHSRGHKNEERATIIAKHFSILAAFSLARECATNDVGAESWSEFPADGMSIVGSGPTRA